MLRNIKNHIDYNYGSRRGLLNHYKFGLYHRLGRFSRYKQIDWSRVNRLVFICHGNICRSPLAEIIARDAGVNAVSYGLHCRDDAEANPRAIAFAQSLGVSLEGHRTRNIRQYVPTGQDLIVVMEPVHLLSLGSFDGCDVQITLAGLWLQRPNPYLHDPYSAQDGFFKLCESRVSASVKRLVEHLGTPALSEASAVNNHSL